MQKSFENKQAAFLSALGADKAFDFKKRAFMMGNRKALFVYVIGYVNAYHTRNILGAAMGIGAERIENIPSLHGLAEKDLPFAETEIVFDPTDAANEVLRGSAALLVEGFEEFLIFDVRLFLLRGPEEPDNDRTLRGPHVGLNESMISNLVQIRRFLRTGELETRRILLGETAKTEIAVLSLRGRRNEKTLQKVCKRLETTKLPAISIHRIKIYICSILPVCCHTAE